jgi:hypothetical protein
VQVQAFAPVVQSYAVQSFAVPQAVVVQNHCVGVQAFAVQQRVRVQNVRQPRQVVRSRSVQRFSIR